MMIKIYVTIYLEREKRLKSSVLLVLWVKGVVSLHLQYTLVLWVWGFPYHLVLTPSVDLWSFIFYVWYLDKLWYDDLTLLLLLFYFYVTTWTLVPYSKCTQLYFMNYIMVTTLKTRVSYVTILEEMPSLYIMFITSLLEYLGMKEV